MLRIAVRRSRPVVDLIALPRWQGTQNVEDAPAHSGTLLATIQASPLDSIAGGKAQEALAAPPPPPPSATTQEDQRPDAGVRPTAATVQAAPRPVPNGLPPPATAPVRWSDEPLEEDYFGD